MNDQTRKLEEEREENLSEQRADFDEAMRRISPFSEDDGKLGRMEDAAQWTDTEVLSQ